MTTLFRRALDVLPRLGVEVTDLGPGAAVVSRRGARSRHRLGRHADLVVSDAEDYAIVPARDDLWLVARGHEARRRWLGVQLGKTGAHLFHDGDAQDERPLQIEAANFLGAHHVAGLLHQYEVNCVVDVGANAGQYGRRLRQLGYRGRIASFEPVPATFRRLQKAAARDADWLTFPFALGSEETTQQMNVEWSTMNSLLPPSEYGRERYARFDHDRTEEIPIRRLDAVMDAIVADIATPRPFLKMDTQGFDLEVFAGGADRIEEFVGMQSEVAVLNLYEGSPTMLEAVATYQASGFDITGMYPVSREKGTGRVVEFDCVLMRKSAAPVTDARRLA